MKARRRLLLGLLAAGTLAPALPASAQKTVAVLSSEAGPYRQALSGLNDALGRTVPLVIVSEEPLEIPRSARVVVAFGSKAALEEYPQDTTLVYALTPGLDSNRVPHENKVRISMMPAPRTLIEGIKMIQPGLKRLGVLYASGSFREYLEQVRKSASALGVELVVKEIKNDGEIPAALRDLYQKGDALWLPADPLLLDAASFTIFKEFAWSNGVPFYAPTSGLAEKGATASIGPSFQDIGRAAAQAVKNALADHSQDDLLYPERIEIVLNKSAAERTGPELSPEALKNATRVLP